MGCSQEGQVPSVRSAVHRSTGCKQHDAHRAKFLADAPDETKLSIEDYLSANSWPWTPLSELQPSPIISLPANPACPPRALLQNASACGETT